MLITSEPNVLIFGHPYYCDHLGSQLPTDDDPTSSVYLRQIEWVKNQFGPGDSSQWPVRWVIEQGIMCFRDHKDYLLWILKWR